MMLYMLGVFTNRDWPIEREMNSGQPVVLDMVAEMVGLVPLTVAPPPKSSFCEKLISSFSRVVNSLIKFSSCSPPFVVSANVWSIDSMMMKMRFCVFGAG